MDNSEIPRRGMYARKVSGRKRFGEVTMRLDSGEALPYVRIGNEPLCLNEGNSFVYEVPPRKNGPLKVYFSLQWEEYEHNSPPPTHRPRPFATWKPRSAMKGSREKAAGPFRSRAELEDWFQDVDSSDDNDISTAMNGLDIKGVNAPSIPGNDGTEKAIGELTQPVPAPKVYKLCKGFPGSF